MNQTNKEMRKVKTSFISAMLLTFVCLGVSAQTSDNGQSSFKPNGKPLVTIFSDFRYNVQDGKSNPAFELSRAYFGYIYNFSPNFSSKVLFDVSNTKGLAPSSFTAYVKNAYVEYATPVVKVDFGMIGTTAFNLQESVWGRRYLLKSFQDLNGFSSSADLGASVKVQIAPQLSFDAQVLNGEGYQNVQADSTLKVAAGVTYEPIKNLYFRVYGDYLKKNSSLNTAAQKTVNAFVAYKGTDFTIGGEYNLQHGNKMVADHKLSGVSLWGSYNASNTVSVFARYDHLTSNTVGSATSNWNAAKDGNLYVAGVEFFPTKGVSISPNIQYNDPKSSSIKSTASYLVNVGLNF